MNCQNDQFSAFWQSRWRSIIHPVYPWQISDSVQQNQLVRAYCHLQQNIKLYWISLQQGLPLLLMIDSPHCLKISFGWDLRLTRHHRTYLGFPRSSNSLQPHAGIMKEDDDQCDHMAPLPKGPKGQSHGRGTKMGTCRIGVVIQGYTGNIQCIDICIIHM